MRIAIVAPLFEHVPPTKYGGTERIIFYLVEELIALGHSVTLYATDGSKTSADLFPCYFGTLREHGLGLRYEETEKLYTAQIQTACSSVSAHDIVHIHHALYPYHPKVLESIKTTPVIWTDHNSVHEEDKPLLLNQLANLGVGMTALSSSHRKTAPSAPWLTTIHHGLPEKLLTPTDVKPTYLAFLGRICPEKGICTAVWIADNAHVQLKVGAKVDKANRLYYEEEVAPQFQQSDVSFLGELTDSEKGPFLSAAIALIFPICWEEPFGLVMIEAMACGCPVIAFNRGSVKEIIEDGVTGYVVETKEQASEMVAKAAKLNRERIRQRFEERFVARKMAEKYVETYEEAIESFHNKNSLHEDEKQISLFLEDIIMPTIPVSFSRDQLMSVDAGLKIVT
jgi:glycosyltransferase involved in cell wall biosynthesis